MEVTIPDLDKIIRMSSLFGMSTDYLLKEEIEELTGGIGMVVLLLMIVVAVGIFVLNGIHYSRYDYLEQEKILPGYGMAAIYLFWSFRSNRWEYTWIMWPAVSVLYAAIIGIVKVIVMKSKKPDAGF